MTIFPLLTFAAKVKVEGVYYNIIDKANQAEVTSGGIKYTGDIVIPSTITYEGVEYNVTSIGNFAFEGCDITSIIIPKGIKKIGYNAFLACKRLTSVVFPEGVVSLGSDVFNSCSSLTSVVLPRSIQDIGSQAFIGCPELQDVFCYSENVPSADSNIFNGSLIEYATLHVPSISLEDYQAATPWSGFGQIMPLDVMVSNIILDQTEITLIEGESTTITATVLPNDASNQSLVWSSNNEDVAMVSSKGKVIAMSPGTAIIAATANDGSKITSSCEVVVTKKPLGKCAKPSIAYIDGNVLLTCDTEGVEFVTEVIADNAITYYESEFSLFAIYTLNTYSTKAQYENSDTVSLTICWIECSEEHKGKETTDAINISSVPVLIQSHNNILTLSGLIDGVEVAAYDISGNKLATATASNGIAALEPQLTSGSIAIVSIGKFHVKIAIK